MPETLGPIELVVLGFEGNRFTGDITPALLDLVDRGVVRIIDIAVIIKDADGTAAIFEAQELTEEIAAALIKLTGSVSGLLSEADLNEIADDLDPNTTVAAILLEHLWATEFAAAVRASGGSLIMSERIPGAVVDAARATLIDVAA